jgi:anaerobic selenocysteine-containing dehydrogenase
MALSWMDVIIRNKLYDELYCKRWTNGALLYCADIEPSGFSVRRHVGQFELKTKLLKESDIKAGGNPHRFMAWDKLHNRLIYFDSSTGLWEGETFKVPTKGIHIDGGFLPEPSQFNPAKDPALFGKYTVTLKDGKTAEVTPVFQLLANRVAEYTPVKAEKVTGVPAEDIELAAKTYATRIHPEYGNGGIHYQLAIEHTSHAVQNCRAMAVLVGITGNFDGPAGNRGPTWAPINNQPGSFSRAVPLPTEEQYDHKMLGGDRFPLLKWNQVWADASSVWDAVNTGKPYPVKGCIDQSGDFMNMSNPKETWEALKKLDFYLAIDLWHHPTVENADIILPAAHWLELDSTRMSQGSSGGAGATCQCIQPPAEAKPDIEIAQLLFKAMGKPWSPDPKNPWPGVEGELDMAVDGMKENGKRMSWKRYKEKFQQEGWYDIKKLYPEGWGTYRRYEMGLLRSHSGFFPTEEKVARIPGVCTPTGLQEIWCTTIETYHPGQNFELPRFDEPWESPVRRPDLKDNYPLTMITGRRIPVYFHSEHRQLPWCREQWPVPLVEINPETAAKYGIKHGDWVWIENDRGRVRQKADLYYGIAPDVIQAEHQWWFPEMPAPEHGWRYSAINQLVDSHAQCELNGTVNLRAYLVKIYKATEGAPEGIIASSDDKRLKRWLPVHEGRA